MKLRTLLFLIVPLLLSLPAIGQVLPDSTIKEKTMTFIDTDSGVIMNSYSRSSCKGYDVSTKFKYNEGYALRQKTYQLNPELQGPKFLIVHGNVAYDFLYQSNVDTPINQQNFQQHTERVYLDLLFKEKYPIKLAFVARQSNSPFFKNFADLNFHFDPYSYTRNLKQDLINKSTEQLLHRPDLDSVEYSLKQATIQYTTLKGSLENPSTLQKIIEERESQFNQHLLPNNDSGKTSIPAIPKINLPESFPTFKFTPKVDTSLTSPIKVDSLTTTYTERYDKKEKELDSLLQRIQMLQHKADSIKNVAQTNLFVIKQKIYNAGSEKELHKIASDNGIPLDRESKIESKLSYIKTFSVGKSMLDYTELTAQNITITGINIEYNPSYYVAFAAGKIDYDFRDFFGATALTNTNGQYLVLGRVGMGNIQKKALIFTLFEGRKSQSQYSLSDSSNNYVNILGYSVEGIYKPDKNTIVSAEFAKSTESGTGNLNAPNGKKTNALWDYADRSNMGVNFKGQTVIPATNTKLSGFYRRSGENFQSFTLFSYNTDQTAWQARVDQPFLKNRITVTGMLRRNDFTNPLVTQTYKTSTIFKSVLLNIRFPKYPSLTIGYYPGTQLYAVNGGKITENAYYILNGSLIYSYICRHIRMNTSLIYNSYFNQATDSGFILYKGVSYYGSQTLFFNKLQLQGGYTYNEQPGLLYSTIEISADYSLRSWLKIGGGVKYNKVISGAEYTGGKASITTDFKKLGGFQLQYNKSYLPTTSQTLYPVEIGRVSWYKYF